MITINYDGRLGNNLFQNFVGILLSEKFKENIQNPVNSGILINPFFEKKNWENTVVVNNLNFFDIYNRDEIDVNLNLNDFFQNREIVNLINNKQKYITKYEHKTNKDLFVHVRLGDLLNSNDLSNNKYADYSYYNGVIDNISFKNGFISSDSPNHPTVVKLIEKYGLRLYEDTPINTLIFASSFEHKILSLGTFSWWMGFLGNQNNIFYPDPKKYTIWHGDIFVFDHWNKV